LIRAGLVTGGLASVLAVGVAVAHPEHASGARCPAGRGMMGGRGQQQDMQGIHDLLAHRSEIRRTVKQIPGGVETLTESDVPAVAARIREHVAAMYQRLEDGRPIHGRDPLFAELFRNADRITLETENTAKGLKVVERSDDPHVVKLIRQHAEVVSAFLANGHEEMMRNHPVSSREK
jgi:hypothetical protein